jgi:hypothetical protein
MSRQIRWHRVAYFSMLIMVSVIGMVVIEVFG